MVTRLVVATVLAAALAGIVLGWRACHEPPFDDRSDDVVEHADRAEAYRGRGAWKEPFDRTGPASVVDAATLGELRGLLGDGTNFGPHEKKCAPRPGVEIVFHDGDRTARLLICFECDLLMLDDDPEHTWPWHDFSEIRGRLAAIAKRLFPDDPAIQAL